MSALLASSSSSTMATPTPPTDLFASLTLSTHPALQHQLEFAQRLVAERRYRQAEEQVKAYMTEVQKEIKSQQAATTTSADGVAQNANAAASSSSIMSAGAAFPSLHASLPTLSQVMTTFLPFLRTLTSLRKENETGEYDVIAMADEAEKYRNAAPTAASQPQRTRPPHADYIHPNIRLRKIPGKGRGVTAVTEDLPDGCAAPCAPSSSEADGETDDAAKKKKQRNVCIPANTTLMVAKAIGFVSDTATASTATPPVAAPATSSEAPSSSTSAAPLSAEDAHEERMATALVTLLALKMSKEHTLIPELYQLDAGERYDEDREERLNAAAQSVLDSYRPIPALSRGSVVEEQARQQDLEIDLARLALIVARNAFAPPQPPPEPPSEEADDDSTAAPAMQSTGLWPTCSFLNHSCHPNAHWYCVSDYMFVRTLRDIEENEEVTISYTGFDAKLWKDRKKKCEGWGFECRCVWCEPFIQHPTLSDIETTFVNEVSQLETRVHSLVDTIHSTEDTTVQHRNALAELKKVKSQLESGCDRFLGKLKTIGGGKEAAKDDVEEEEGRNTVVLPAPSASAPKSTGGKKKKSSAASSSSSSSSSSTTTSSSITATLSTYPPLVRNLLLHLSLPYSLLALCHISLHDATSPTIKSYQKALGIHESLSLASIDLLTKQYGGGDDTVVFAWFELLNTWQQFAASGIEYRSMDQMKAIMQLVVQAHCQQFGVKIAHFKKTWLELMMKMGLMELLED